MVQKKSKQVQLGPSRKFHFLPSPARSQLGNPTSFRTRAELSSDIPNPFKHEPSQAPFFSLLLSLDEPAQLKLFGLSQIKLKAAWYTLIIWHFLNIPPKRKFERAFESGNELENFPEKASTALIGPIWPISKNL